MAEHQVDPHAFLAYVHDIEMDVLQADAPLVAALARLPGRKLVFTNGDGPMRSRYWSGWAWAAVSRRCTTSMR